MSSRRVQDELKAAGQERAQAFLRHQAAELNRYYFDRWEVVQLSIAGLLGVILLFATNASRVAMGAWVVMFLITGVQHFVVTPRIIDVGRAFDFAGMHEFIDERALFSRLHAQYGFAEITKWVAGLVLAVRLLYRRPARGSRRGKRAAEDALDNDD
ncbi:MAG: hypothetical protein R2729_11590 [Bryobacteraceae bacterium]